MKLRQKLLIASAVVVPALGTGGLAYATTSGAATGPGTAPVTTPASGTEATDGPDAPDAPEASGPSSETASSGADGAGGHQDPAGANVDHQAPGQE